MLGPYAIITGPKSRMGGITESKRPPKVQGCIFIDSCLETKLLDLIVSLAIVGMIFITYSFVRAHLIQFYYICTPKLAFVYLHDPLVAVKLCSSKKRDKNPSHGGQG